MYANKNKRQPQETVLMSYMEATMRHATKVGRIEKFKKKYTKITTMCAIATFLHRQQKKAKTKNNNNKKGWLYACSFMPTCVHRSTWHPARLSVGTLLMLQHIFYSAAALKLQPTIYYYILLRIFAYLNCYSTYFLLFLLF